jgi:dTDP-4-amino-4,6-dideoxygalactose transaminase
MEGVCLDGRATLIRPDEVPRLPVLDWQAFGTRGAGDVLSVSDGSEHIFTSSGRAAIMLGLESLGVGKGDQVMVPTYHCPTMVAPIIAVGAEPVFYPINERGEALLEAAYPDGGTVKAAIVPHFFGIPQDMSQIRAFCDRRNIALIEDCAHCFFGLGGTRVVGHWGNIAIASLTKFFPVPAGGILAFPQGSLRKPKLNTPGLLNEIKAAVDILETAAGAGRLWGLGPLLRGIFSLKRSLRRSEPSGGGSPQISDVVVPEALGFDVVLAHRAPERICRWIPSVTDRRRLAECRRENYRKLARALSGHQGFSPLFPVLPDDAVPYVFPLRVNQPDGKYHKLKGSGLPVFRWNWLWPGTPVLAGDSGPRWSSEVFQLACHQDLTDEELDCICSTVIRICSTPAA